MIPSGEVTTIKEAPHRGKPARCNLIDVAEILRLASNIWLIASSVPRSSLREWSSRARNSAIDTCANSTLDSELTAVTGFQQPTAPFADHLAHDGFQPLFVRFKLRHQVYNAAFIPHSPVTPRLNRPPAG